MLKKIIYIFLLFILVISIIFGIIDYKRIIHDKYPLFMIKTTSEENQYQTYYGLGYKFERNINVSFHEPFYYDKENKFGLWLYTWNINKFVAINYIYTIYTAETRNCNKIPIIYQEESGYNVYTFCLDHIKINKNEDLKDYYKNNKLNWTELISSLIYVDEANDGGTRIYKNPGPLENISGSFTNNGLTVVKCNTISGNKDIYIGPKWMSYEKDFCLFNNN